MQLNGGEFITFSFRHNHECFRAQCTPKQSIFENLAESLDANVKPVDDRDIIEVCTLWNEGELDGRGNSVQSLTMHQNARLIVLY